MGQWLNENWFTLLQSAGIIGSLFFTAHAIRADSKSRRIESLFTATAAHRHIWQNLYEQPELSRVIDPNADLLKQTITPAERVFVILVILHLSSVYHASKARILDAPEGMHRDVQQFFSRPIPKAIWQGVRSLQDRDFVEFIDSRLSRVEPPVV